MCINSLFVQLLGNGLVQGAVSMLYAAGFGIVYRSFRVFHIAMGAQFVFSSYAFYLCAVMLKLPLVLAVCGTLCCPEDIDLPQEAVWDDVSLQQPI